MEVPIDTSNYKEVLIVLGAAGVVVPLIHRLRISSVLGFMVVGTVVGPFGFGSLSARYPWLSAVTIGEPESIAPIAELGVVLLLFMIGLELSFERLWLMRRLVFGLGMLQVVACASVLTGAALLAGLTLSNAVVISLALAMSSTAVVIQVLSEEKQLATSTGRTSFAVLLFQDITVVPILFVLGALAPDSGPISQANFGIAIGQALVAIVAILALGRLVLRPLFRSVARTQSPESFMAVCLLVVIATSLATGAAGLSMALGALIGGLLLAGTEYRRQVEVTIEPFKGLLVGVFLISIGMSLDIRTIIANPLLVLAASCGLILLKLVVIAPLVRAFGPSWATGLRSGLLLGPGGEFGFVILSIAIPLKLVDHDLANLVLIVTAVTMVCIPLLSKIGNRLAPRIARKSVIDPDLLVPETYEAAPRTIIAGFGRVGQTVASMLEVHNVQYVAIDRDPDRVARQRALKRRVYYGDITRIELLRHLHLDTARALVVTMDDPKAADEVVANARSEREDLLIVVRARDAGHAAHLYRSGASDAVPETIEASLQLSEAVLVDLGIPMGPVIASIHEKRSEFQAAIKAMAPAADVRLLGRRRLRDAASHGA